MDLKLCINQMIEYTRKFKAVQSNPQIMIDEINALDTSIIEGKLNNEYSDDMSDLIVNQYRKDLLTALLKGKKISLDEIDEFIIYRKTQRRFQWSNHLVLIVNFVITTVVVVVVVDVNGQFIFPWSALQALKCPY